LCREALRTFVPSTVTNSSSSVLGLWPRYTKPLTRTIANSEKMRHFRRLSQSMQPLEGCSLYASANFQFWLSLYQAALSCL
jgi:hypothetical protein